MPISTAIVSHRNIADFAGEKVNLKREDASEYRAQVNRLREKMESFIKLHPESPLIKMLLSGSLAKGTALKSLNDIDVAVYVKASEAPNSQSELLQWLAERLREAYPQMASTQIQPANHAVRISFMGTGLDVDVVPVHYAGLPEDRGHLYSIDTGKLVLTSIPLHLAFIRARKATHPDHFAQVVRLLKWWVRQRKAGDTDFRCKSFLVELLCAHLADTGTRFDDYPAALEAFFTYVVKSQLRKRIAFSDYYSTSKLPAPTGTAIEVFDPVNPENSIVAAYTERDRQTFCDAAEEALDSISEATFAQTKERAVDCWREVLGPSFMR